jgi:hypothetical protein
MNTDATDNHGLLSHLGIIDHNSDKFESPFSGKICLNTSISDPRSINILLLHSKNHPMKNKWTVILFHVVGCTIFLLVPIIFWPGEGGIREFFTEPRALRGYFNNILILLFFYLNYYLLIPRFYFNKKYLHFTLIILGSYFIIAYLPELLFPFQGPVRPPEIPGPGHHPGPERGREIFKIGHNLVFFLAVVFFSLMLKINNRLKQTEREKLRAELQYFKAQINPHFLFNTLNTIYSLAIQKADNAPEAVVKLSGMMRYVITDASHDFVPLEKEISYITDFIDLQKIRFGETVQIGYNPCEPGTGKYIAPLILIPFIENAFKFGVNPEKESLISVRITLNGSELHLAVFNYKVQERSDMESAGGLGISNARQRLNLLYPEKHRLMIIDNDMEFKVDLYITLP